MLHNHRYKINEAERLLLLLRGLLLKHKDEKIQQQAEELISQLADVIEDLRNMPTSASKSGSSK